MDRSTAALLLSLLLHALVVWFMTTLPSGGGRSSTPVEVTYQDPPPARPPETKSRTFLEDLKTPETKDELHDAADFFSNANRRFKKQVIARKLAPETRNTKPAAPSAAPPAPEESKAETEPGEVSTRPRELKLPRTGDSLHRPVFGPGSSVGMVVPGIEFGDITALNSDQDTYYVFYSRIASQVVPRWANLVRELMSRTTREQLEEFARMNRVTTFEIVLDKDGDFHEQIIHYGSGIKQLDQTAVEAFRMATPFVNPPRGMVGPDGLIHLYYRFTVYFRPPLGQAGY